MMKFYKCVFLAYFLLFLNINGKAQLNAADSTLFNSIFTSTMYIPYWNFPYKWYSHDSITSMQDLQNRFNTVYPFVPADFNDNTYTNIKNRGLVFDTALNASFNLMPWIYDQTDPVMKLPFMLNGKYDTAYAAFTPGMGGNANCRTAFFIIHGNGLNTTTQLLQGIGYACVYCNVKYNCQQYGDVYTYSKPNDDWRATYWNRKKLNDYYTYNYCEAIGHNYGTNYLIETIAMVKQLKSKYDRLIVLGISEGGYTTLLNLMNTEPDGAIISGGYSINFDTYLPSQFVLSNRFGNAPQRYPRDTVKAKIAQLQTNTLFTWGEADAVELMDPEHDFHYTQNFLNNYNKCSFFYNFNTHTFPPCGTLDTFITRILTKPKAFIVPPDSVCLSDSVNVMIRICGQAPFQFQVYRNNVLFSTMTSNNDTIALTLTNEGKYQVKNITDATNNPCINSNVYEYKKVPAVGFSITGKTFICDSNHTAIALQLAGTAPWHVQHTFDGIAGSDTFLNATVISIYGNGELQYLQISDSNHCTMPLNQFININDSLTDITMGAPVFSCDSAKTKVSLSLKGRSPWTFAFKKNGVNDSLLIGNAITDLYFENGFYEFLTVADSNHCQKAIGQLFTFDFDTLGIQLSSPVYHCDSNKTQIQFSLHGNPPFAIHYLKDAIPQVIGTADTNFSLYFENGNYTFLDVTDSTACVKTINQNFHFSYNPLSYTMSAPIYDCDSNRTRVHFDLQGNTPWTIEFAKGGNLQQYVSNTNSVDLYLENDIYNFNMLSDSTCALNLNQGFSFNYDTLDVQLGAPVYHCDSNKTQMQFSFQGNAPFEVHYTKDGIPMQFSTGDATLSQFFENGNYVFLDISDATGCVKNINQNFTFNFSPVGYTISGPVYHCDSNKTFMHFDLQGNAPWILNYTQDGTPMQISSIADSLDLFLTNGIYQFTQLTDATCAVNINQSYVFNQDTLDIQMSAPAYSCDSGKAVIQFDIQGNPPYVLHYTKNGTPMSFSTANASLTQLFENGYYIFQYVTDATGCVRNINISYNFNYNALIYTMSQPQYNCDSNKTYLHFDLQGNAPWIIHYTMNGNPQQALSNTGSADLYLENGIYQFVKITDASCVKYISQSFVFNYDSIDIQMSAPVYNCDSNRNEIHFSLQGNPPFELHYTKNGTPLQIVSNNAALSQYFGNGYYDFTHVTDATGCMKNINLNFSFSHDTIDYTMTVPQYHCDSNKTFIHFDLQGNPPWVIDYLSDGNPQQVMSSISSIDLFLSNGYYQFLQIRDSTNCVKNINQAFTFNYDTVSVQIAQELYDCDSNKYRIDLVMQGNTPWTIEYNDGNASYAVTSATPATSLFLENGNWTITKITDVTACVFNLNYQVNVNFNSLTALASTPVYDCDSNKSRVDFSLTGNAPWVIYFNEQNLMLSDSVETYDPNVSLFFSNGLYLITQVKDSTGCTADIMQTVNNFYTPLSFQQNPHVYYCDSTKMKIDYSFTGDAPYVLTYKNNISGIITQLSSILPSVTFFLPDGEYTVLSVADLKCTQLINDTISIHYPKLISSLLPGLISCDSDKVFVQFHTPQGNPPYTYSYYYNNVYKTLTTYDTLSTFYMANGQYFFEKVTDSMGCSIIYNQTVNAYYEPYQYNGFTKKYLCEKDSTALTFNVNAFTKTFIAYTYNAGAIDSFNIVPNGNNTFILPDGVYQILYIIDSAGCMQNINQQLLIEEEPVDASYTIALNCDLRKYTYTFSLQGRAPWTVAYNRHNLPQTLTATDSLFNWNADAGVYYMADVTDSNGCRVNIQKTDTLKAFLDDFPTLYYKDFTLHTIQTPHRYYWYKDEVLIDTISKGSIPSFGKGVYKVMILDELGCNNWSNELILEYPSDINVFPNPVNTVAQIVVNDDFGEYWQYQLFDMSGKLLRENLVKIPSAQIDMSAYEGGVYTVIIRYANQAANQKHVIRLMRN